ncbi:hypothetical protein V6N13_075030 [Hibiscus sabdariffa]
MVERSLSMRELHFESVFGLEVLELNETSAASKSFGRDQRNPLLALMLMAGSTGVVVLHSMVITNSIRLLWWDGIDQVAVTEGTRD